MNERDMTMLVERAGTQLQPDVETLVAGGIGRGRTRRRRRRAGSAVAALAVVGSLGVLLGNLSGGGGGTTPVASEPTKAPSSTPTPERVPIDRAAVPAAFASLFGGTVSGPLAGEGTGTDFRWEGFRVRIIIAAAVLPDLDPAERCTAASGQSNCVVLADGTAVPQLSRLDEPRARGLHGAEGYTSDGFDVSIAISNASGSKSGPIQSRGDQLDLLAAVASDVWFK
jgi:hypothetical protein